MTSLSIWLERRSVSYTSAIQHKEAHPVAKERTTLTYRCARPRPGSRRCSLLPKVLPLRVCLNFPNTFESSLLVTGHIKSSSQHWGDFGLLLSVSTGFKRLGLSLLAKKHVALGMSCKPGWLKRSGTDSYWIKPGTIWSDRTLPSWL